MVGASLVPANRRAWAVSMSMVGLPVANIIGVPVTTLLGQRLGWQAPFLAVGVLGLLTLVAVWFWVAPQPVGSDVNVRSELSALARPQVWMALLVGMVGFGGMFATYSYIAPTMTELAGFSEAAVTIVLAVYGVGMTVRHRGRRPARRPRPDGEPVRRTDRGRRRPRVRSAGWRRPSRVR